MDNKKNMLYMGSLNSEIFWDNGEYAGLPALPDKQVDNIILALDEIQYVFCDKDDILLTGFAIDNAFFDYLKSIGIDFICNREDIFNEQNKQDSIFKSCIDNTEISKMIAENKYKLSPYAVLPYLDDFIKRYKIHFYDFDMQNIKTVNSKIYSTKLRDKLGIKNCGKIVCDVEGLEKIGDEMLEEYGKFILKHPFGVSGKGSILVESKKMFSSLSNFVAKQSNKRVEFILERYLNKVKDISSQFYVHADDVEMIATQEVINNGLSYAGTKDIDDNLREILTKNNYFNILKNAGKDMAKYGYIGDVCIDSMLLENDEVEPIVEINARKSMSLVKHNATRYFKKQGHDCVLSCLNVRYNNQMMAETFLEKLNSAGLLFSQKENKGILPLSINSLFINSRLSSAPTKKGRLFYVIAFDNTQDFSDIDEKMKSFMSENGFNF